MVITGLICKKIESYGIVSEFAPLSFILKNCYDYTNLFNHQFIHDTTSSNSGRGLNLYYKTYTFEEQEAYLKQEEQEKEKTKEM